MQTNNNNFNDHNEIDRLKSEPLLSKSTNISFNTGNIVSNNRIKKKSLGAIATQSNNFIAHDEISECIQSTLTQWILSADHNKTKVNHLSIY